MFEHYTNYRCKAALTYYLLFFNVICKKKKKNMYALVPPLRPIRGDTIIIELNREIPHNVYRNVINIPIRFFFFFIFYSLQNDSQ